MSRGSHTVLIAAFVMAAAMQTSAQTVVGDVYASDASVKGTVMLAAGGTRVFSGSQVGAGATAATLRLARGGEVRICPGTNLTLSSSSTGNELLLSLNAGSIELHYTLASAADSIMTPDFQIQLVGPGEFHIGFGADERGATCVRGLAQNNSSVIVSEMMGDGRYQVQPHEEVVFHEGRVNTSQRGALVHCGCPAPVPIMQAENKSPAPATTPASVPAPVAVATPAEPEPETHVQVDAPFVFHGDSANDDIAWQVSRLQTRNSNEFALQLMPTVIPPREPESKLPTPTAVVAKTDQKKGGGGFFKKLGRFFGKIFKS
jgi:hypothetical protein